MLNYIWAFMIVVGVIYGAATGNIEQVGNGAIESAEDAVKMCITMLGIKYVDGIYGNSKAKRTYS